MIRRESIYAALWSLAAQSAAFATTNRRLRHWSDVGPAEQPALFMAEKGSVARVKALGAPVVWTLYAEFYLYAHSSDPYQAPADNSGKGTYNGMLSDSGGTRAALAYGSFQMAQWFAFTASGQSSPYPELDASTGIANSMAAAAANCNEILINLPAPGFLNFSDFVLEAIAAA